MYYMFEKHMILCSALFFSSNASFYPADFNDSVLFLALKSLLVSHTPPLCGSYSCAFGNKQRVFIKCNYANSVMAS